MSKNVKEKERYLRKNKDRNQGSVVLGNTFENPKMDQRKNMGVCKDLEVRHEYIYFKTHIYILQILHRRNDTACPFLIVLSSKKRERVKINLRFALLSELLLEQINQNQRTNQY